jgi:carboxylesterase
MPNVALMPGAEPFSSDGPPVDGAPATGVLLVHGFTGSPHSMRPWALALAAAGLTVRAPLLPGHGTDWREMNRTGWRDWYGAAEAALAELRGVSGPVFVMGLSMGGTLTLRLAEEHGAGLAGIVTVNASLGTDRRIAALTPVLSRIVSSVAGIASDIKAPGRAEVAYDRVPTRAFASMRELWKVTRADLGRITVPVLAYRSRTDHVVEESSGRMLLAGVTGAAVEERILENSYHVATLDNDAEEIFAGSIAFVRSHSPARARG